MTIREKRIALVTGANKGIGFEVVRQLAREGFRVFLGARNEKAGEEAAEKLDREAKREALAEGRTGVGVTFVKIDISEPESIRRAAEEFSRRSDRLDALVNNAGIVLDDDKDILTITPDIFETTFRKNTLDGLFVSQAYVPFLTQRAYSRVLNVANIG